MTELNVSWADAEDEELHPSIHRDGDEYDYLGRNVSAQARRQKTVRWEKVKKK